MNCNLREEIVGCLGFGGSVQARLRNLRSVSARDWEASLHWLNLSGIALTFWDRVQQHGAESVIPPQVRASLTENLVEHRRRVSSMMPEFNALNERFERAGIDYTVWKGFALIPEYCPDAGLRPSYDYDYVISQDAWQRAQDLLDAAGYARKSDPALQVHATFVPRQPAASSLRSPRALYAEALPRKVELHLQPWDDNAHRISIRLPERPLSRKIRRHWQGLSFYALDEQDAFVFQMVHAFQHILHNWCRLGWLLEIAYFLRSRSTDSTFWTRLDTHLAGREPLREIVALVISLAARLYHASLPAPIEDRILTAMRAQVALWVDRYGLSAAVDNFAENKYTLFLYREFVKNEAAWREVRRRSLLPVHRPNRVAEADPSGIARRLPPKWKQAWYVMRRLTHHSLSGAGYAFESLRWTRLRRLQAQRAARWENSDGRPD
jgi:hypothetical protein